MIANNGHQIVASEATRTALYKFHRAEKRREKRRERWKRAKVIAMWIWAGAVIAYLCHFARHL